jgi:hypothetical protein
MAKPRKSKTEPPPPTLPTEAVIHYIKTASYRTHHADGIFGGLTASGKIYVEFFVQRPVTPQVIRQAITPDGMLGQEIAREGKTGIVREIEVGIVMDIPVAVTFKEWLDNNIKAAHAIEAQIKEHEPIPEPTK